jgi:hypothetical protein
VSNFGVRQRFLVLFYKRYSLNSFSPRISRAVYFCASSCVVHHSKLARRITSWVNRVASGRSRCSRHVRYAFNSDRVDASQRNVALCHVWTAPSWQGFSSRLQAGRCSHVFGLLVRHTRPLAIMPSADQVPVKSPHSTMHWHMWVVLIAGSTGSALRAVRPPNLHITPDVGAISFTPQVRRVPCSDHL